MDHVLLFCEVEWVGNTKTRVSGKHCGLARPPNSPALHLLPCDHHDHHWECGGRNNGLPFSASFMFFLNLCSCFHLYFYLYAYLSRLCLSALTSEECGKQEEEAKTCLSIIESHNHSPKLPTRFLPFFQLLIYSSQSRSFWLQGYGGNCERLYWTLMLCCLQKALKSFWGHQIVWDNANHPPGSNCAKVLLPCRV